ncbi:MAG: DUF4837 family protein [Flavobacteriales bacterium]
MQKPAIPILYSILLVIVGCDSGEVSYKPEQSGMPGEMVVVSEQKIWESEVGELVRDSFQQRYPGLPQSEPMFDIGHYTYSEFNDILKKHRNLLLIEVSDTIEKKSVQMLKEYWASEQLLFRLKANNKREAKGLLKEKSGAIISRINNKERERVLSEISEESDNYIKQALRKDYGFTMEVDKKCRIRKNEGNFVWIEKAGTRRKGGRAHDVKQGIIIYTRPYKDSSLFSKKEIIKFRDSMLKKYIPGPSPGSYMTTETRFPSVAPIKKEVTHEDQYAVVLRGLWRVENDFMGGPFISLTTYDKKNNQLVTVEGYVYAPKFNKREYVREVEAMVYSMDLVEKG